ncbi:MAG TPA: SRPBCC family protein [Chloroflexota bacterium]
MATQTDRIHKELLLNAPLSRVWHAVSDAQRFGEWFGVRLDGAFTPGALVRGQLLEPGYEHLPFEVTVERVEPERHLSFRWHPHAIQTDQDYSKEPTTLIVFELQAKGDATLLTVDESGFDALPLARRLEAYRGNEGGWTEQMQRIARYVGHNA